MKLLRGFLLIVVCFIYSPAWCIEPFYPRYGAKDAQKDLAGYKPARADTSQFMRAVRLGRYHVYKPGEHKQDLDSAHSFYLAALKISGQLKTARSKVDALNLLGAILYERGEHARASALHEEAAGIASRTGDLSSEAECWYLRGEIQPYIRHDSGHSVSPFYQKSLELFRKAKNVRYQAYVLARIGGLQGQFVQDYPGALANLLESQRLYKSIRYPRMHYVYFLATEMAWASGMYSEAMRYGELAIESSRSSGDLHDLAVYLSFLGKIYDELQEPQKALVYYKLSVSQSIADGNPNQVLISTRRIVKNLLASGKVDEARKYFAPIFAKYPPRNIDTEIIFLDVMAHYHTYKGQFDIAEKFIRQFLKYEPSVNSFLSFELQLHQSVGKLYLHAGRLAMARKHLNEASKWVTTSNPQAVIINIDIQKNLYKLDSAQGNYALALEHFRQFKILSDSIYSVRKSLQIAGIQIQFDLKKKEQDIQTLSQQNKAQLARLAQREFQRNAMVGGTLLLTLLLLSLYVLYRNKQKNNLELKSHQQVIEESNTRLTRTVEEKQLLVREIHHRVKNNLQTVISLLESQAFYLENDALTAVKDSQSRIHAMSLIHQKLYLTENVTSINMQVYIEELVSHLGSSHPDSGQISVEMQIDEIYLDVAQAIPLGLIINEAVTNIFKYAFPNGMPGEMLIRFSEISEGRYTLSIHDNGIGLNTEANRARTGSLGMNLMKGLSRELGGDFILKSDHGVKITVQFASLPHFSEAMHAHQA
ncbi:Two-component sensor histidine kinase, contains HisKA and HATPase domains [Dyadobacter soli]|uniref:histidine kinase n=1 Tax=Dyadobacter soli TaxID=659014 RepID=A0A1G7SMP1_9BACT|nr:sensor histidine kinase [Dyadobacter soli]SDG24114.1 Two-component sensor histidine kinase, contains HisKA and HATPase domains [Dyadobacter soli]